MSELTERQGFAKVVQFMITTSDYRNRQQNTRYSRRRKYSVLQHWGPFDVSMPTAGCPALKCSLAAGPVALLAIIMNVTIATCFITFRSGNMTVMIVSPVTMEVACFPVVSATGLVARLHLGLVRISRIGDQFIPMRMRSR